jgi:drug/metabolite transporter (DMT)-like permease
MWLTWALLSGLFYTGSGLITRYILKGNKDAWAFSFYFSFIGALVSLPFVLNQYQGGKSLTMWGLILFVGLLIVGHNWLNFKSSNYLEASVGGAVLKLRLAWVLIFSALFFNESLTWYKLIGTGLAVFAGVIIVKGIKRPNSVKGTLLALGSTLVYAAVIMFYKILFRDFNSVTLTFFIFLIPTILNLAIMPKATKRLKKIMKLNGKAIILACGLGGLANLAMNEGLSGTEATKVLVVIESFLVLALVGEHFILKEKEHLWVKFAAVICATAGAILIRLS